MAYFIGVDLHKTQFTVHIRTADFCEEHSHIKQYPTNAAGYDEVLDLIRVFKETDSDILVAIESTGNACFFRDKIAKDSPRLMVWKWRYQHTEVLWSK